MHTVVTSDVLSMPYAKLRGTLESFVAVRRDSGSLRGDSAKFLHKVPTKFLKVCTKFLEVLTAKICTKYCKIHQNFARYARVFGHE